MFSNNQLENLNKKTIDENIVRNLSDLSENLPLIGREAEMQWMCQRLLCRFKPNILLLGEPGIGKTALVEGLAAYAKQSTDPRVKRFTFMEFSAGSLIAGTSYRGDFEKKIINLIKYLIQDDRNVIFIDEAHCLAMTGDVQGGGIDALNLLKPFLTSGQIRCIMATTPQEMNLLTSNKAFMRRFAPLYLHPLSRDLMDEAIRKKGEYLQQFHKVSIDESVFLFIEKENFHDKYGLDATIDFLDEIMAAFSMSKMPLNQIVELAFAKYLNNRRMIYGI